MLCLNFLLYINKRWNETKKFFADGSARWKHHPIIMPINIGNYHWVVAVRKQNGDDIMLYYVDNLYNKTMEDRVKSKLMECGLNEWFLPPRAG